MIQILYVTIGLAAGILSGLVGIGGGIIIVPILIYLFGMSQLLAQGTTVALLVPPLGLLAAYVYFKNGQVNVPAAIFIALGVFIGSYFGARLAITIPEKLLTRVFGIIMLVISVRMIFGR